MPFIMVGKIFTKMLSPLFVIDKSCLWLLLGYRMLPPVDYALVELYIGYITVLSKFAQTLICTVLVKMYTKW